MAKSKLVQMNEKIAGNVTSKFCEISNAVIGGYTKIEDRFVDQYLTRKGESVAEAKARLKRKHGR
ncbi:hypothetical protein [Clostridium transplantifaecale]|uniref:hypothetical protein n=1 Tax=Clostridium transplantifaecale TaxID=2479838 RepID=UPI000F62C2DC|nr:hypothetical protein [Clostridium transplantifaecale]